MKSQKEKAIAFKLLHDTDKSFIIPNPWDKGTAKILAHIGFEALATTSAGLAFSLGRQDLRRRLSFDEVIRNAKDIISVSDLPVSADLENGYSDSPEGVYKSIIQAGESGLVGASIEDATGIAKTPIYDFILSVERIHAAVEAKNTFDFHFMLTARSENFVHGIENLDDTIKRLHAYQLAGADVLYAPDLKDLQQIREVLKSVHKPLNVMAAPQFPVKELEKIGVKRISLGSLLIKAALGEFLRSAMEIKEKGTAHFSEKAIPFGELMEIFDENE